MGISRAQLQVLANSEVPGSKPRKEVSQWPREEARMILQEGGKVG